MVGYLTERAKLLLFLNATYKLCQKFQPVKVYMDRK